MLEVKNLEKHFGDFVAVKGVSFSVKAGEVLGFLGPKRRGKIYDNEDDHGIPPAHIRNSGHRRP